MHSYRNNLFSKCRYKVTLFIINQLSDVKGCVHKDKWFWINERYFYVYIVQILISSQIYFSLYESRSSNNLPRNRIQITEETDVKRS